MKFLFTINTSTHFKERCISYEGDTTPLDESAHSLSSSLVDDNYFAIHLISMDIYSQSLCVANGGGHVMVFDFLKMPPDFTGVSPAEKISVSEEQHDCVLNLT